MRACVYGHLLVQHIQPLLLLLTVISSLSGSGSVYSTHLGFRGGLSFPFRPLCPPVQFVYPLPFPPPVRSRPPLRSPAAWRILVQFRQKYHPSDCLMTNNILCLLSIKRMFPWNICNSLPGWKKFRPFCSDLEIWHLVAGASFSVL